MHLVKSTYRAHQASYWSFLDPFFLRPVGSLALAIPASKIRLQKSSNNFVKSPGTVELSFSFTWEEIRKRNGYLA